MLTFESNARGLPLETAIPVRVATANRSKGYLIATYDGPEITGQTFAFQVDAKSFAMQVIAHSIMPPNTLRLEPLDDAAAAEILETLAELLGSKPKPTMSLAPITIPVDLSDELEVFCLRLASNCTGVRPIYAKHVAAYGELLPYLFVGEVARHLEEVAAQNRSLARAWLEWIESELATASPRVENIIGAGFVENLPYPQFDPQQVAAMLPLRLLAVYEVIFGPPAAGA
jgi:hypothetical protein